MTKDQLKLLIKEEGDYHEWVNNINCFIQRNNLGSWCGYIIIPNSFSIDVNNDIYLNCHGGVTYQSTKDNGDIVIGFDCGHNGDLIPYMFLDRYEIFGDGYSVYRNKEYVISEVNSMVEQILQIRSVQRGIKIDNILDSK